MRFERPWKVWEVLEFSHKTMLQIFEPGRIRVWPLQSSQEATIILISDNFSNPVPQQAPVLQRVPKAIATIITTLTIITRITIMFLKLQGDSQCRDFASWLLAGKLAPLTAVGCRSLGPEVAPRSKPRWIRRILHNPKYII